MRHSGSFGHWVRRRRKLLDMTQADLARRVSCSLSMLRKIERDERRPSEQLAALLADHLAVDDNQRRPFMQMARGIYVRDIDVPIQLNGTLLPALTEIVDDTEEPSPFVARERELQLLHEHLDKALEGQGRMVFIAGEAGWGKTSLLHAFARQAMQAHTDLIVAGGRCDVYTGQADPLLPFHDIFRLLVGDVENAGMKGVINRTLVTRLARAIPLTAECVLNHGPHLIGTLVPGAVLEARLAQGVPQHSKSSELLHRLQGQRARQALSDAQELRQDRLFDEISTTLKALTQQQPILLMLDDLHWVDHSSAALLGHLAMRLKQSPILIVGSYRPEHLAQRRSRDGPEAQQHPLQEVLSESLRQFGQNRIKLEYSDPSEQLDFVNALLDEYDNDFGSAFRRQLARRTEGNSLFVVEVLRDMRERGDILQAEDGRWKESESIHWETFPARVEGVIEKRIARLPEELRGLLTAASVQGETFIAEVIAQVVQADLRELTRRLSEDLGRQHRLIREQGVRHAGAARLSQYRFRHFLIQKYLYGRLAAAERMYLHEAVGDALEALFADSAEEDDVPASQLARHFQEARQGVKASRYLLLAGQKAAQLLAYDEATAYFLRGLSLLQDMDSSADTRRLEFELTLALARAHWHGGRVAEALTAYEKSIEIARTLHRPNALARAVLAYEDPRWRLNLPPDLSQQFMREALAAMGEGESGLRVRLLVSLSRSLLASGDQEELRATVDQALCLAREMDDPVALCDALRIGVQIDRRPQTTAERLAAVQEMIVTAEAIGDLERQADGLDLYVYDLLELSQIDLVDKTMAVQRRVAHEIRQPFQMHVAKVFQTMRAIMRGEFETAERLANEAAEISQQIGIAELDGILGIHMFTIRREQGRLEEIAPLVEYYVAHQPASTSWRPGLALIYRALDQREACRAVFEDLASEGFRLLPQDSLWVAMLAYLSEVCAYLGDVDRAATLYELLLPYGGRAVVVGGATACYGSAARYLGMLARTMSDRESAERHFEGALELDARMEAWPWLAHSQFEYAAMLLERGRVPDRERAIALLGEASTAAQRMGMAYLLQQVATLQARYELVSS